MQALPPHVHPGAEQPAEQKQQGIFSCHRVNPRLQASQYRSLLQYTTYKHCLLLFTDEPRIRSANQGLPQGGPKHTFINSSSSSKTISFSPVNNRRSFWANCMLQLTQGCILVLLPSLVLGHSQP